MLAFENKCVNTSQPVACEKRRPPQRPLQKVRIEIGVQVL